METREHCVYVLTCHETCMKYVGRTSDFKRRLKEHSSGSDNETKLQQAIDKYGWDSFEADIEQQDLTLEEADILKSELIVKLNTYNEGYNMNSA